MHLGPLRRARWHPASFFEGPPQLLSYGSAHRGDGHPNARLLLPHLAVALQSGIVVVPKLAPQEPLPFGSGEDAPSPSRGDPGRKVLALPPHLQPAFEGGKGDGEDLNDLPPGDAPIHRGQSPDPEVLRVDVHAQHPYTGPLYSQTALYLALCYPERCSGLFLESASPGLESEEERASRSAADEDKAKRLESGDFDGFLRDWYSQPLFAPLAWDEGLLRRTIEERRRNDPVELARSLRGMGVGNQPPLWEELEGLAVPALAVAGDLDEKYATISSRMASISPRIGPVVIPGVGHNVRAEAPTEYAARLRRFLDRLSLALGEAEPVP